MTNSLTSFNTVSSRFPESAAPEFLKNGFVFGLGPEHLAIGWGKMKKSALAQGACSIFAPDFYMTEKQPWLLCPDFAVVSRKMFASEVLPALEKAVRKPGEKNAEAERFQWVEPDKDLYKRQFDKIQQAIENDGLKKAVPVMHALSHEPITPGRLLGLLRRVSDLPPTLTAYGFWRADDRTGHLCEGILGGTPEFLFSLQANTLHTMALAGTRSKTESTNGAEAMMNDAKERHEHQIVADDIRFVLSQFGQVSAGETFAAELPTLFHLKTMIKVEAESEGAFEGQFMEFARALHPTPALGLAPRSLGTDFLKRWDDVELRGRHGAPFGIDLRLSDGSRTQDCLVAIRNIQWGERGVSLGAGGGIVPQSKIDREWDELQLKRDSVKKVLGV